MLKSDEQEGGPVLRRIVALAILMSGCIVSVSSTARARLAGEELWASRYDGPASDTDRAYDVVVSPDSSKVFVGGSSIGGSGLYSNTTVAYDASTGAQLWSKRYLGNGNADLAPILAVTPDGSIVIASGTSARSESGFDYMLVAYDTSTGTRLWKSRYDGGGHDTDIVTAAQMSPDRRVLFVTGASTGSNGTKQFATIAVDAATGSRLWVQHYVGPIGAPSSPVALEVNGDGTAVFVTGGSTSRLDRRYDYATVAYAANTGHRLWAKLHNGHRYDFDVATDVGVSPDGAIVFVTGQSGLSGEFDFSTVAYDAGTGSRLWERVYEGPANGNDAATALDVSSDGSLLFVTGSSLTATRHDYATIAYDSLTGSDVWSVLYDGPVSANDVPNAVGVSPDGSAVFVGGFATSPTGRDYAIVAYDISSGYVDWTRTYDSDLHGSDILHDLAVSSDGSSIFVTGASSGSTRRDFATIAYGI
jgi:hypothetical protein